MIYAAIIAAAAALIGAAIASGDNAKAMAIRQGVADKYKDLPLPTLDAVVAQKLPPEAAAKYAQSTQSTQAESDVLGKYMGEVNSNGETPEDRAAYIRMKNAAGGIEAEGRGAAMRGMANRGLAGSGMSAALQMGASQDAANRASQMGTQEAADSRTRYLAALQGAGNLSGQMRGQEMNAMQAQDAINMFNARQQSDADFRNQQLPQQNFDNQMSKTAAEANALNGVASTYERGAQSAQQTGAGIGNAAITTGAAYDQYGNPIPKKKQGYQDSAGADDGYTPQL